MKRPMCILAVSWLSGLLLASHETRIGTGVVLISYVILIIFGLFVLKQYPHSLNPHVHVNNYPQLTILLLLIPCIFLTGHRRMESFLEMQKAKELPWQQLLEEGETYVTVEGIVKEKRYETQIILELKDCVIIGYYGQENRTAGACRVTLTSEGKEWLPKTEIGNTIRVFGRLFLFQQASNPGQFDARDYYLAQGLFAEITALRITVPESESAPVAKLFFSIKKRMRESITALYPENKAGVLTAMLTGDKDLLSEEVEALYRKNGISHILAISGLHISLLCMGFYEALRKLTVPISASVAATAGLLVFYVLFTGAGTSSLRAGIMCLVLLGSKLFRRSYDLLSSLSLAAILVTCIRPGELDSAGCLLSFGAVLGVALAQETEYRLSRIWEDKKPWWSVFLYGGMIQCVTLPVSLWFFYELSPYSLLLNLIVIPLVSLILGGGLCSAILGMWVPSVAKLLVGGTSLLLEFYEWLCRVTQKLPFSFVLLGRPKVWQLIVYYIVFLLVLWMFFRYLKNCKKTEQPKWCGVRPAAGMLLCFAILCLPGRQSTELLFLDVSQGDGLLIFTEEGTVILSDCGSSDVSKVGEYRLSPVLKQKGILLIDMAVVSHLDSDHTSGIRELLENMPVYNGEVGYVAGYEGTVGMKELVLPAVFEKSEAYLELESLALKKNVAVRYLQAGKQLYQEENLLIECIYPVRAKESENDTSLVLLLQTPELLAWLMGDAGTGPEKELMEQLAAVNMEALQEGKQVLLKVGHHGSQTSSGESFLAFVRPDISIISCGYRNFYGHPHDEVVKRLQETESLVFRTDLQGAIVVEPGKRSGIRVRGWLKNQRE